MFGAGITPGNVRFETNYSDLLLHVGVNTIKIQGQLNPASTSKIESLVFADGSTMDMTGALTFTGTPSADSMTGTAGDDTLYGQAGNDGLSGGNGNDLLYGGLGNDTLAGENGDDTLFGGEGDDILNGDGGFDTASYALSVGPIAASLATGKATGEGNDTFRYIENLIGSAYNDTLTGDAANNRIEGGAGNDILNGGAGIDTVSYAGASSRVAVNLSLSGAQNTLGAGTDTIIAFENIIGSAYNDTLTGDAAANVIEGGAGNDVLNGGAGVDTASYASASAGVRVNFTTTAAQNTLGAGTDTLFNFENIIGSAYNDTLTGNSGANVIEGGAGNDIMDGGAGVDTVSYQSASAGVTVSLALTAAQNTGGAGTDTIIAFENIIGSAYNDTLTGNAAANVIEGGAGNDTMDGGAGTDTVSYQSATGAVTVNLALTTAQNTGGAGIDTLLNFERLIGSNYNDRLTGDAGSNQIEGGAGNDIMDGGAGIDTVNYLFATAGVTVNLALTTAQNTGGAGYDTITNFESINGSAYNDVLYGNSGANTLRGGNGDDLLYGAGGVDNLYGEAGADTFLFDAATAFGAVDIVHGFSTAQGDKLKLADMLIGYNPLQSAIDKFVILTANGANTTLSVDRDGAGTAHSAKAIATLNGVTGLDVNALLENGNLLAA